MTVPSSFSMTVIDECQQKEMYFVYGCLFAVGSNVVCNQNPVFSLPIDIHKFCANSEVKPTHAAETGTINRLHFPAREIHASFRRRFFVSYAS